MPASADHRSSNISPCWTTPREAGKVLYPLPEILLLLLCETVAGADDFVEIALWGNEHLDFLRPFLPYQGGIPIERQKRSYLCSTRLDVDSFARIVRGHWGIENRLYWVPDVVFRDDLARLRSGQYGHHQHTANLLTQAKPAINFKNRRKKATWNQGYLARVIAGTA